MLELKIENWLNRARKIPAKVEKTCTNIQLLKGLLTLQVSLYPSLLQCVYSLGLGLYGPGVQGLRPGLRRQEQELRPCAARDVGGNQCHKPVH